jgi:MFS family permease
MKKIKCLFRDTSVKLILLAISFSSTYEILNNIEESKNSMLKITKIEPTVLLKESLNGWLVLTAILLFISFFAMILGPVLWIYISEIFPNSFRGKAVSIVTIVLLA